MDPRPENDPNQWADLQPSEREERRYAVWLERSLGWRGIAGAWKPVKVLGAGSYGLCGLFKYVGNGGNFPAYIVVKQSGGPDKDLRTESRLMKQLGVSRSPHIIKLYKSYHEAAGTGTSDQFDPSPYNNVPNGGSLTLRTGRCRAYIWNTAPKAICGSGWSNCMISMCLT